MTAHALRYGDDARQSLQDGLDILANAVKTTLGPRGHNVALGREYGLPLVVNDGVSVAKDIELQDPFQNLGARLVRQAAEKAEEETGDGTTTATVLAQAIVHEGFRNVAAGADPMALRRGLNRARVAVDDAITARAIPVVGTKAVAQVATISGNDAAIGRLIGAVMERVGRDGAVTVEESQTLTNEVEYVEGMQIDQGYLSPYFVTDPDRMEAVVNEPSILITDRKVTSLADIVPILEKLVAAGRKDLLLVAESVEGEALATLVVNRLRGTLNVVAVKAPGFGDRRKAILGDLAIVTGATVISEEVGKRLDRLELADLGAARRVIATQDRTTIIEGQGDGALIKARVAELRAQVEAATSDFDLEKLKERLAKLAGGVAVIRLGASTETELTEVKHRVEDALAATRAALEEGVVPGGGVALLAAAPEIDRLDLQGDEAVGARCLRRALAEPMRQIAANAGYDGGVIVATVQRLGRERRQPNLGFNAVTGRYVDMVKAGIIDPAKVTHAALDAAVSTASMLLTTEAAVTEKEADGREFAAIP
ncbi:MAG: chaperonin GroEL [Chloroflexota bacterium]